MSMSVDTSQLNQLAVSFTRCALTAPAVVEGAQRTVAPKILEEQIANIAMHSGDLSESLAIEWGKGTTKVGAIVPGSAAWRAHFMENGTAHNPPQPAIRPAGDKYAPEYATTILRLAGRI